MGRIHAGWIGVCRQETVSTDLSADYLAGVRFLFGGCVGFSGIGGVGMFGENRSSESLGLMGRCFRRGLDLGREGEAGESEAGPAGG